MNRQPEKDKSPTEGNACTPFGRTFGFLCCSGIFLRYPKNATAAHCLNDAFPGPGSFCEMKTFLKDRA